ncbi:hypothetical protein [Lentzea sp. NPDC004782]|uniref:hypothetical protein n=1 Tax=Lentzea sp. NPDC004782 TaxID=3154458 RepID=UPI0033BEBF79
MTREHDTDDEYVPCGTEQIVHDDLRLSHDAGSDTGTRWALRALGHQLRAEPELVEHSLHIITTHGDRAVVAAASILASILLEGVPCDQLTWPIEFPVEFTVPGDLDSDDRAAWQENVKVASAAVSAYATRDAGAIQQAAAVMCRGGESEVLAVLVTAAVRKLSRHASWFGEAMRAAEQAIAPNLVAPEGNT